MQVKFSEDVVPLAELKVNPGKVVRQLSERHRPVLLTSRGRGVAVVEALDDFERKEEERAFMQAVVKGMADLAEGRETSLAEAKKLLLATQRG
ncbi:MAG: type II toxin-antitoxin system Phd/YefM family antitoxin [Thermodesulfobacteriota bacterium]|jgi:prevent-host-death family protein